MPNSASRVRLIFAVLALSLASQSFAEVLKTHHLKSQEENSYKVSGADPYLVLNPTGKAENAKFLLVNLNSAKPIKQLQLYFNPTADSFDPWYRLDFKEIKKTGRIALKLPSSINLKSNTPLRVDIDACNACLIEFSNTIQFSENNNDLEELSPTEVYNGIESVPSNGKTLALDDWQFNSINGSLEQFEIEAIDPYLVSPKLNLGTENLAAIYFQIQLPENSNISNDFQLFYATENHGFSEQASSHIRAQNTSEAQLELLFPVDFLSQQIPSDRMLDRIRIDIPLISGAWSVTNVSLISDSQFSEFEHLMPSQLIQNKRQKARGLSLIKNTVSNIFSDLGFSLSYLLLITLVSIGFFRAYKK